MRQIAADRFFAAVPDHVHGIVTVVADCLYALESADEHRRVRYTTSRGLYAPGAVVEVHTVPADGGCVVRATAVLGRSFFGRIRGEKQRLDWLFATVGEVLEVEGSGPLPQTAEEGGSDRSVDMPAVIRIGEGFPVNPGADHILFPYSFESAPIPSVAAICGAN